MQNKFESVSAECAACALAVVTLAECAECAEWYTAREAEAIACREADAAREDREAASSLVALRRGEYARATYPIDRATQEWIDRKADDAADLRREFNC